MCLDADSNVKREMRESFGLQSQLIIPLTGSPAGRAFDLKVWVRELIDAE
jgi:hypothetical protein